MAFRGVNLQALGVEGGKREQVFVAQVGRVLLKLGQDAGIERENGRQRGIDGVVAVAVLLAELE